MKPEGEYMPGIIVATDEYYWEYPYIIAEDQKNKKFKILFLFSYYQNYLKYGGGVTI